MKTKAVVTVELQIEVGDTWSADTSVEQVRKQSKASAEFNLRRMLDASTEPITIIGKLKSTVIMLEE